MKKLDKKGFTLAELLIVVAIIAILVAIGIPAFSTAMERSRESVDLANTRAAYAEFMAGTLNGDATCGIIQITVKQKQSGWIIDTTGLDGLLTAPMTGIEYTTAANLDDKNQTFLIFTQAAGAAKPSITVVKDWNSFSDKDKYDAIDSSATPGTGQMTFYRNKTT